MYRSSQLEAALLPPAIRSRGLYVIFPLYAFCLDGIARDLLREKVDIVEKRYCRVDAADLRAWLAEEMEGETSSRAWPPFSDGPTLLLHLEGGNLFEKMRRVAAFHNAVAAWRIGSSACYASNDEAAALRDLRYFFPHALMEDEVLRRAEAYLSERVMPMLEKALAALAAERPPEPLEWLISYLREESAPP